MPSSNSKIILVKTPLGRAEMTQRALGLSMVERRLLILTDGTRTQVQLGQMMATSVDQMLQHLQGLGLLAPQGSPAATMPAPLILAVPAARSTVPAQLKPASSLAGSDVPPNAFADTAAPDLLPIIALESDKNEGEATEDELASDFSEQLTSDGMSEFERESSRFVNSNASGYPAEASSTLQRAITTRGIALGKAYLINISSRLLDSRDAPLLRSIAQIKTEGELYHQFELVIDTIGSRLGSGAINEILENFDAQINQA